MESTIERRRVYEGKIVNLRVDRVALSGGGSALREVVEHPGAVAIVAVDASGHVLMVRQFRKAVERELMEIPAGTLELKESPETCAARELREETGYRAGKLQPLSRFYSSPGFCDEELFIFLATDLQPDTPRPREDENPTQVRMPLDEAVSMARNGQLHDSKSIIGLLLAECRLNE
jgi:ADP-ribose pyrophosphatase